LGVTSVHENRGGQPPHHDPASFWVKCMRQLHYFSKYLWALPMSCVGILVLPFVLASGGTVSFVSGIIEAEGGILAPILSRIFSRFPIDAITIGHVIFGCSHESIIRCRVHERIHVRQYERWGPIFPLLYLASSSMAIMRGKNPYRSNIFEQDAFSAALTDSMGDWRR
jgi:hypothetical protein